ncbi:uncharacterized protein LOC131227544 isoform X2 [Magnolia sinica]|uniref:uncharacterized protein LOC131227544 isoform X2 n=1 Tax=Magnolia sinica TaxID=86752 RepID=UPI00265A86EC|nr:uncharacterized protein LOC131227544 isoform X2 [Magnolia sinica]
MATTCSSSSSFNLHRCFHDTCFFQSSSRSKHLHLTFLRPTTTPTKVCATAKARLGVVEEEIVGQIKRLQNGPDIRGVALEGEKGRTVDFTPQAVEAIAESFGEWVINGLDGVGGKKEAGQVRVSVGRDPRISGPSLSVALFKGLAHAGCLAFDMGLATTPACYMSTLLSPFAYDASIMIVVNAGNGSGGFFTWDVLEKLGADTTGSLNLEPDGMFPNHIPNPEDKIAMSLTKAAVLEGKAHLGIVFDTDVDRSGVVDEAGNTINGDRLIALMAAIVLREYPGTTIVTDARTSVALTRFITSRGGHHCLYRVGYRNVIDKGVQLNKDGIETHLMMETSGHGALRENNFLDDGAYMVVKIIIEMVRMKLDGSDEGIGSLIRDLEDPVESVELRMNVLSQPNEAKKKGAEAVETLRKYIEEGRLSGWELDLCGDCWVSDGCLADSNDEPAAIDAHMYRIKVMDEEHGQHGWIHIRQSVHNPNIALNLQSSVPGGCQSMSQILRDRFLMASGLDKILDIAQVNSYARKGNLS